MIINDRRWLKLGLSPVLKQIVHTSGPAVANKAPQLSPRIFAEILMFGALASSVVGCGHLRSSEKRENPTIASPDQTAISSTNPVVGPFHVSDPEPPKVIDAELESIPTELNPKVEMWLSYFQGKGRRHMERYLSRSSRYSKLMRKILSQNGLPEDLIYLALIESGFSSRATSRAAAVGYWQFMRYTGKRYGLDINTYVDERRDPVMATQAAADYLKGLYSIFGSWYLALASYNVGEYRVKREVMRQDTEDYWELSRKRRFPKETINYVPKFIAAKLIGNNPEKYGFADIEYEEPIEFDTLVIDYPVNLRKFAEAANYDYEEFRQLNPKFRGEVAPSKGEKLELRIPVGTTEKALGAVATAKVDKVEFIAAQGETRIHRVTRGDTLGLLARKYHTTAAWLRDANDLGKRTRLRVGMALQVPEPRRKVATEKLAAKSSSQVIAALRSTEAGATSGANAEGIVVGVPANDSSGSSGSEGSSDSAQLVKTEAGSFYVIKEGNTLSEIADDFGTSVRELRKMNGLRRGSTLKVGQRLRVPTEDDPVAKIKKTASKIKVAPTAAKVAFPSPNAESAGLRSGLAKGFRHTVQPGENLYVIAKKYNVSIESLRVANKLRRRSLIHAGLVLIIPGATATNI